MASSDLQTGSALNERVLGVAALILACPDLEGLQYRHLTIIHRLEGCLERARVHRLRTGNPPKLEGLDWLSRTVQDHPAFEARLIDAKSMQVELQGLIARIAHGR